MRPNLCPEKCRYATVKPSAKDFTTFTATAHGGARPDPVLNQQAEYEKHFDAPADIVLVDGFTKTGLLGVTDDDPQNWHRIIIEYTGHSAPLLHNVIAHEIGHGVGLEHAGHYEPQVLDPTVSSDNVEQSLADADAYD